MNNLKSIYIASLLLLSTVFTYGQKSFIDSICLQIDDKIELGMSIYDYSDLGASVENDLKSLHAILEENKNIPETTSYSIFYSPNKKLSIEQSGPTERIIWENGKQTSHQFNNLCEIESDKYHLQIEYNDLESLVSNDLILKLKEVIDSTITVRGRFSSSYNYVFTGASLAHNEQLDERFGETDIIFLKAGVGVNLIKNQPVIDLSAEMGVAFSRKGILKHQYYLSYNLMSDFIDNSTINLNSFLNLGYRYNLSKTTANNNWLGVEVGYLVSRNGDMFNENTFKFGVNWEVGKYMSISPQLYISEDLTYPALRIGFGF